MARNFFLLVLLSAFLNGYECFSYSAKVSTKNNIITYQEFSLSPLMVQEGFWKNPQKTFCKIHQKKLDNQTTYDYLLSVNSALLECFTTKDVKVYGYDDYKQKLMDTNTIFFIHPIRFTVDFKEDFANIYLLNQ